MTLRRCITAADVELHSKKSQTYDAVLDAEAELVLDVGSLDADLDDGRARHDVEPHHSLVLGRLKPQ